MERDSLLSPYRVLDLTDEKGFLCGKLLGDLGADVIKVEPPGGDPGRKIGPFYKDIPNPERSLFWWAFNTSKRGIVLDIKSGGDKEKFKRLVKTADFVVESFSPGYLDSLGLGYEVLSQINPRLILTSITPFGQTGPYRDFKGSDMVLWGMGGMIYSCGFPDRPPVRMSVGPQAYLHGGVHAAIGTLLAHWHREMTGEGQHIDISIQGAVVRVLSNEPINWFAEKKILRREGNYTIRGGQRLRQIWPCKDGYVSFRVVGGRYGRNIVPLVKWMAEEGLSEGLEKWDWESLDIWKLSDSMDDLEGIFARFFLKHTRAELVEEAIKRRFMLLDVSTVDEILQNKHLIARDFWAEVEHPEVGQKFLYPGAPYKFSLTPWRISRRAPLIGEHNQEVFAELDRTVSQKVTPSQTGSAPSPTEARKQGRPPLEGVKVIDLTLEAAGGFCTAYLGDFGADVVRIESETALCMSRLSGPFKDGISIPDNSHTFVMWNSSKLGVALNLKAPEAKEVIRKLVLWADVVINNLAPGVMARLGLSYEDLRKIKPDIIMLSASALGQTGPYSKFAGFGWHISGPFYELTGWPDREPLKPHLAYTDHVAPWFLTVAVLAALDYRRRTGKGQYIDLSQLEATLGFMSIPFLDYTANGRVQKRKGNQSDRGAPHAVYPCKGEDRWCAIAVYTEEEWRSLCQVMGNPSWARASKFATFSDRKKNETELDRLIGEWTVNHDSWELMTMLQAAGVAAGVVENCADLLDKDPQIKHWGLWPLVKHPVLGLALQYGWPVRLPKTPYRQLPAPCLGEHTEYVLCKLMGLPDEEFINLMSAGVFR